MQLSSVKLLRNVMCMNCTDASAAKGQHLLSQRGQCAALECSNERVRIVVWCHESVPDNGARLESQTQRSMPTGCACCWICSYVEECTFPREGHPPKSLRYVGRCVRPATACMHSADSHQPYTRGRSYLNLPFLPCSMVADVHRTILCELASAGACMHIACLICISVRK